VRLKLFYIDQPYSLDEGKAVVKYTLYLHNYLLQSFVKRSTSLTTTPMERSAVKSWRGWWHALDRWHPRMKSRTSWRKPTRTVC